MTYIKTYEGFFSNLFKRKSDGSYYWHDSEVSDLEACGFERENSQYLTSPFYYYPQNDKVSSICLVKNADVSNGMEDYFYVVTITLSNDKIIEKDFDSFSEMLIYVKKYIPEIELDSKKYNL